MAQTEPGALSAPKRLIGLGALIAVIVGSIALGMKLTVGPSVATLPPGSLDPIITPILGFILLFLGAAAWGIVLVTHSLTFDFSRPYFRGFRKRCWIANLIVSLLLQVGVALMMAPTVERLVGGFMPAAMVTPASLLIPFLSAQFFCIWFQVWAPLEILTIRRRARTCGISPEQIAAAKPIGISNAARNSFKKLSMVEEEMGLLWFSDNCISYRGDTFFDISREQLIEIERKADAGSTASYFGAVDVVLHVRQPDGTVRKIRLHPEGIWTMNGKVRARNQLALLVESWKVNVPLAAGFPVSAATHAGGE